MLFGVVLEYELTADTMSTHYTFTEDHCPEKDSNLWKMFFAAVLILYFQDDDVDGTGDNGLLRYSQASFHSVMYAPKVLVLQSRLNLSETFRVG